MRAVCLPKGDAGTGDLPPKVSERGVKITRPRLWRTFLASFRFRSGWDGVKLQVVKKRWLVKSKIEGKTFARGGVSIMGAGKHGKT